MASMAWLLLPGDLVALSRGQVFVCLLVFEGLVLVSGVAILRSRSSWPFCSRGCMGSIRSLGPSAMGVVASLRVVVRQVFLFLAAFLVLLYGVVLVWAVVSLGLLGLVLPLAVG